MKKSQMEILELIKSTVSEMKIHCITLTGDQKQQKRTTKLENKSIYITESNGEKDFQNNTQSFRNLLCCIKWSNSVQPER